jgi:hypothetical protein
MNIETLKRTYCHLLQLLNEVVKNEQLTSIQCIVTGNPNLPTPWEPVFNNLLSALTEAEIQLKEAGVELSTINCNNYY